MWPERLNDNRGQDKLCFRRVPHLRNISMDIARIHSIQLTMIVTPRFMEVLYGYLMPMIICAYASRRRRSAR